MITRSELNVKYYTDESIYFAASAKQSASNLHLKYKKLSSELETNIRNLKDELEREKAELSRDRKLLKLAKRPITVPATATTAETVTQPDEKNILIQEHDLKMKFKKVKNLTESLGTKIESLKLQFEMDYQLLKTEVEQKMASKRQIESFLEFHKDRMEHGYSDGD